MSCRLLMLCVFDVGEWCVGGVLDLQRHASGQRRTVRPYVFTTYI
jgi:hypothetical protein